MSGQSVKNLHLKAWKFMTLKLKILNAVFPFQTVKQFVYKTQNIHTFVDEICKLFKIHIFVLVSSY